jgi:hypothetical protein
VSSKVPRSFSWASLKRPVELKLKASPEIQYKSSSYQLAQIFQLVEPKVDVDGFDPFGKASRRI